MSDAAISAEPDSRDPRMTKYLLDFQVEAHACFATEQGEVRSSHPRGDYEVHISNLDVTPGVDRPLLSIRLIVEAADFDAAKEVGRERVKEYLDLLSFVTNLSFRLHKLIRIVDWSIGAAERHYVHFERFPADDRPYPVLKDDLIRSIEVIEQAERSPALRRALKWFGNGVRASDPEDQFQYFWFVLEVLAQIEKPVDKVNDRCPKCRNPLFCENCNDHPTHRPFPKQAILALVRRNMKPQPDLFFDRISEVRNRLLHGDEVKDIEKSMGIDLSHFVDRIGELAWHALLNTIVPKLQALPRETKAKLILLRVNQYSHKTMHLGVRMASPSKDPNTPSLNDIARPEIELILTGAEDGSEDIVVRGR